MKYLGKPVHLALVSVSGVVSLALAGWASDPSHSAKWLWGLFLLPALWASLEIIQGSRAGQREHLAILNFHRYMIAGLGVIFAVSLAFKLAISSGYLGAEWASEARRIKGVLWGLGCMAWGNYLPKLLSPWKPEEEPFDWQRVHRFCGRLFFLGGAFAVLCWLWLPITDARLAAQSIVITASALSLLRKFYSAFQCSRRQPPPTLHREADDAA